MGNGTNQHDVGENNQLSEQLSSLNTNMEGSESPGNGKSLPFLSDKYDLSTLPVDHSLTTSHISIATTTTCISSVAESELHPLTEERRALYEGSSYGTTIDEYHSDYVLMY